MRPDYAVSLCADFTPAFPADGIITDVVLFRFDGLFDLNFEGLEYFGPFEFTLKDRKVHPFTMFSEYLCNLVSAAGRRDIVSNKD